MAEGYEDIEKLTAQKQTMLNSALKQQNDIVNQQTQMNVDSLERQKADIDKEATNQNRALYKEYRKASNPFGVNEEVLASQGLGNSGIAETSRVNLYNTYQQNITNTLNNARDLKSNVDFQIQQARQTGNITMAENALQLYMQKLQLLTEEYELKNDREKYLYQKQQDALAQSNWEKEYEYQKQQNDRNYNYQVSRDKINDAYRDKTFDYQKSRDLIEDRYRDKTFDYQKSRDAINDKYRNDTFDYQKLRDQISDEQWDKTYDYQRERDNIKDEQWEKEYELSKKASASSRSRSYSTTKSSSSTTSDNSIRIDDDSTNTTKKEYTPEEILSNAKMVQLGVQPFVQDGITGNMYKTVDALLNHYGYARSE